MQQRVTNEKDKGTRSEVGRQGTCGAECIGGVYHSGRLHMSYDQSRYHLLRTFHGEVQTLGYPAVVYTAW